MMDQIEQLLREPAVIESRGLSHTKHWDDIKKGLFVPPVRLGVRSVAWPRSEVARLNAARIAGKTDDEIRELVRQLVAARADAMKVAA